MDRAQTQRIFTPYERTHLLRYGRTDVLDDPSLAGSTPVEYLTGCVEFADLILTVSPDTLIPRIETEGLVDRASELLAERGYQAIADIGTGCGAIILGLAKKLHPDQKSAKQRYQLFASDVSAPALAVAQKNCKAYPKLAADISLLESNLLDAFKPHSLDLIIANLPYIPDSILKSLDESVLQHEPLVALDGGKQGFALIESLLTTAPRFLRPGGAVLLEIDYTHDPTLFAPCSKQFDISFFPDYRAVRRFAQLDLKTAP